MNPPIGTDDPRKLETVIRAGSFVNLYVRSLWKRDLLASFLEILEKIFDTEVLLRVPESLRDIHPSVFKNLLVVEKLRKANLIEKTGFFPNLPDEPPIHRAYARGATGGSGANFLDPEKALWSALGEGVERSLWFNSSEWYEGRTRKASYKELEGQALNPFTLVGFTDTQKESSLCHITEDTPITWIKAKEYVSGKTRFVPLQLLSAAYSRENQKTPSRPQNEEPLLRSPITTGLATSSKNLEEAVLYGALEAIERDAFMIGWLNQLPSPQFDLEDLSEKDPEIGDVLNSLKRYRLQPKLLLLPTDFPFSVVAAILIDESGKGPAFSIGAKAHWDLKKAMLGALGEAASVRHHLKDSYKEDIDLGKIGRRERLIYWAQPENLSKIDFYLKGPSIKADLTQAETEEIQLDKLLDAMREKGLSLYASEISSRASRALGFYSAYVCTPDLQPMHLDERVPAFGGSRLREIPAVLGYAAAQILNTEPHPFP